MLVYKLTVQYLTTLCLKKCTNFEMVYLKVTLIDFDEIWQEYSKYSRIEFMCFSLRVGLLLSVKNCRAF